MDEVFAHEVARLGPFVITDSLAVSVLISFALAFVLGLLVRVPRARATLEVIYGALDSAIRGMVNVDAGPLVPLIITLWAFVLVANLIGLLPGIASPTRDLAVTAALALVSFFSGHIFAFRERGWEYLKDYVQPNPILLPFNIIGELSRTLALALRLFGNVLSGELVVAILLYVAGVLAPVPLMLLTVLTSVVQAYIFGVLTLVFAASSLQVVHANSAQPKEAS